MTREDEIRQRLAATRDPSEPDLRYLLEKVERLEAAIVSHYESKIASSDDLRGYTDEADDAIWALVGKEARQ